MARQTINTGSSANDGTGDTLRIAGQKINENFQELYGLAGGDDLNIPTSFTDSGINFNGASFDIILDYTEPTAARVVTIPDATGTIVLDAATQTITNKTISVDNNTVSGIAANSFVLSNGSGNINGSAAQKAIPSGVVVGTTDTQTLTNKTLNAPTLLDPIVNDHIHDINGAELIIFSPQANAVRELTMHNADSSGDVSISATGKAGDANINLLLQGKGTGVVRSPKIAYDTTTITANGTVSGSFTNILCNKATALGITLANGTVAGEIKIFTNINAGVATVTPTIWASTQTNPESGSTVVLDQYDTVQMMWTGTSWYVIGGHGYAVT